MLPSSPWTWPSSVWRCWCGCAPTVASTGSLLTRVGGRGTAAARHQPPQAAVAAGAAGPLATTPATSV
jgi:hypothetical protein